jgi:hypothetical protein
VCCIATANKKADRREDEHMSSTIFTTDTTTRPRQDATIRIQAFKPGTTEEAGYITVDLLEFHPDYDERLKFRSYALVKPREELTRPEHAHIYQMCGAGYLEQPYISINEVFIHPADLAEMMKWCRQELAHRQGYTPLVIHPQPRPFPMFKKGARVIVVAFKDDYDDTTGLVGELATTAQASSPGARTQVTFDNPALNKGYKSVGIPSIALREVKA